MSDIDRLEYLSNQLHQGAQKFANAAQTLRQQAQSLDWSAQDLASGVDAWAGAGSRSFTAAWNRYHNSTQKSATALDNTSQALSKLAQKIDDSVQQMRAAQAMETASTFLTVGLVVLDVVQLGLDPVTDAATVGAASADVAVAEGADAAATAVVEADAEIASELDEIEAGIENTTDPGDIAADGGGEPGDISFNDGGDGEPPSAGGSGNDGGNGGNSSGNSGSDDGGDNGDGGTGGNGSGDGGTDESNDLINQLRESGAKFNEGDIVGITRTPSDKIVWLEEGNPSAGLEHIMNGDGTPGDIGHAADFAKIGVDGKENVTKLIIDTLRDEIPIGSKTGGKIYNVVINGVFRRIFIVVGSNGFIVTAYPL